MDSNIAKAERDHETALAAQRRERVLNERHELDRATEDQFVVEKKRRLARLGELERR
jgi:hypothetical protein